MHYYMRTKQKLVMKVTDNLFKGFQEHGLRTPNEGINQRNPKILADVADKIYFCPYLKISEWGGSRFAAVQ